MKKKRALSLLLKILWRKSRLKFKKVLKVLWEIVYYGIIYLVGTSFVSETQLPFWLINLSLIFCLMAHKFLKNNYKDFKRRAEYDEFHKRFVNVYKLPCLFPQIIIIFILANYCSFGSFVILVLGMLYADCKDRQFYSLDIKQNMIREKLGC